MASLPVEKIEVIRRSLRDQPKDLTASIARQAGVPEGAVLQVAEGEWTWSLDPSRFEAIMEVLTAWHPAMVVVKNRYAVMESYGRLGGYSKAMGYFNVKTEDIDLHIKVEGIASAYLVNRPTKAEGMPSLSVQFFDGEGEPVLKIFLPASAGGNKISTAAQAAYERLLREFLRMAS